MKTVLYTRIEQKLIEEWMSLWENSPDANFTNSPYWFLSVIESFSYTDYIIITIYKNEQLVALAPLIKEKKFGIKIYTVPPGDFVCGIPFLIDSKDKEVVEVLIENLLGIGTILINNVPSTFVMSLKNSLSMMDIISSNLNFHIVFEKDEQGQVKIENKKKHVYRIRNIQEKFALKSYSENIPEALEIVFTIDCQSSKQARGYNSFFNDTIKKFYTSLAKHFDKIFSVHILYFEDKPIAYRIGFIINEIFYASQIAFSNEYRCYSPGSVLLVKFIENFGLKRIKELDFGSGDNYFKRSFTNTSRLLYTAVISENIFARNYIKTVYFLKDMVFTQLEKHLTIYKAYRNIRRILEKMV